MIGDFSISYIIFSIIYSYDFTLELHTDLVLWLGDLFGLSNNNLNFADSLGTIILVFIIHVLFRLYTTLLFGVSLSQGIMGIRGRGNFLWKRIGGMVRVFLELLLSPFLVFDFPLFIRKKTVKEVITYTELYNTQQVLPFITSIIIIPLFVIMALLSPLLTDLTILDGVKISFIAQKKAKLSNFSDFASFKQYTNNYFKFSTFSDLLGGNFLILPSFDIAKIKNKKKIAPTLIFYDKQNRWFHEIRIKERISLLKLLNYGRRGNLLFKKNYPSLSQTLDNNLDLYKIRKHDKIYNNELVLSQKTRSDIKKFISRSFELSFSKVLGHLFDDGPFIKGHVLVRNKILDLIDKGATPVVEIVQVGDQLFLKFVQSLLYKDIDHQKVETYIPIETNNSEVLEMTSALDKKAEKGLKNLKKSFFSAITWYFDYKSIFTYPENDDSLNPLIISDYYITQDLPEERREGFENFVYHYLFDFGQYSIKNKDEKLQGLLIDLVEKYFFIAKLKNSRLENYYSKRFLNFLKALKVAIEQKNSKYFKN